VSAAFVGLEERADVMKILLDWQRYRMSPLHVPAASNP